MADGEMGNYSFCCRLCLSEKQDSLKSVFDDVSGGVKLAEKISTVVGVTVSLSIAMPLINVQIP